jgi:hypothetical protein
MFVAKPERSEGAVDPGGRFCRLTQVAGYPTEVIKFLPPLNIKKSDIDWFLTAIGKVLEFVRQVADAAWDRMDVMAKAPCRRRFEPEHIPALPGD